jgi:hypothetical protein
MKSGMTQSVKNIHFSLSLRTSLADRMESDMATWNQ